MHLKVATIAILSFVLLLIGNTFFRSASVQDFLAIAFNRGNIFTLKSADIDRQLHGATSICSTLSSCAIEPGDVLIRRTVTQNTTLPATFTGAHFTHAAILVDGSHIAEATGRNPDSNDDVTIVPLNSSDWKHTPLTHLVVLRPHLSPSIREQLIAGIRYDAADPQLSFGIPLHSSNRTTCSNLIMRNLATTGMIDPRMNTPLASPDLLFETLLPFSDLVYAGEDVRW